MEIEQIQSLCGAIAEQRKIVEVLEKERKKEQETLDQMESDLLKAFEAHDMSEFKSKDGKFYISRRVSVPIPKGEARDEFFDYLKKEGIFDELISVNSRTLNAWYKEKTADSDGVPPMIPGLSMPTITPILNFKQEKQ